MAKDTVVFRPGEKFGICAAIAAAAVLCCPYKSRESRESAARFGPLRTREKALRLLLSEHNDEPPTHAPIPGLRREDRSDTSRSRRAQRRGGASYLLLSTVRQSEKENQVGIIGHF